MKLELPDYSEYTSTMQKRLSWLIDALEQKNYSESYEIALSMSTDLNLVASISKLLEYNENNRG